MCSIIQPSISLLQLAWLMINFKNDNKDHSVAKISLTSMINQFILLHDKNKIMKEDVDQRQLEKTYLLKGYDPK